MGAYSAVLGGVDILVFTGGVGENQWVTRSTVCENMEYMGIELDEELNRFVRAKEVVISKPHVESEGAYHSHRRGADHCKRHNGNIGEITSPSRHKKTSPEERICLAAFFTKEILVELFKKAKHIFFPRSSYLKPHAEE